MVVYDVVHEPHRRTRIKLEEREALGPFSERETADRLAEVVRVGLGYEEHSPKVSVGERRVDAPVSFDYGGFSLRGYDPR